LTAREPVEQGVGRPVLAVSQIQPCHPTFDIPLAFSKGPGRVIDHVEMEVGALDDFPRCELAQEIVLITGSRIGIDGAPLVHRHAETSGCGSATNDSTGVLLHPAE
jgi:hypothetical protein